MVLEILFMDWDRHKTVAELSRLMGHMSAMLNMRKFVSVLIFWFKTEKYGFFYSKYKMYVGYLFL